MKRILTVLLILFILSGANQAMAAPSQWAASEIEKAIDYNLVPQKLLSDYEKNITRQEFSEMVVRLYESISGDIVRNQSGNPFSDTTNPEISKAYGLGIVKGMGDGTFRPEKSITREEIAVMLYRSLEAIDSNITEGTFTLGFSDRSKVSMWARNQVGFMSNNGIINGIGTNTFAPKMETTREQSIVLVVRLYREYGGEEKLSSEEIAKLSSSVVQILTEYDNGDFGYGSGFFYETGKIVTNYHVIEGANKITIEYDNGSIYKGEIHIAGYNSAHDIAVLSVNDNSTKPITIGNSTKLIKGQKVYAIGSPIGYKNILTNGIISGLTKDEIQATIPLSEGSSGGVLLDQYGSAIGVTFARMYGVESLGFAKPINILKSLDTSKKLTLKEFNEVEKILNPPINIIARQEDEKTVVLRWDWMEADHFLIYKAINGGQDFVLLKDDNGSEKWFYKNENIITMDEYTEGERVMFAVVAVKDGVVSERNFSNYISLFKGMSESQVFDDLLINLPSISGEGTVVIFEGYDVKRTNDNKITRIYAYVNEGGFKKLLDAEPIVVKSMSKRLKAVSDRYSELIGTDVEVTVLYQGLYDEYPKFLEGNYINPDGIKKDQFIGLWEAEYPLINVANNSDIYITWYGPYGF